ncbi:T9SS type A sorting domain-containing protein, partial [Bacteroidota bacterium]
NLNIYIIRTNSFGDTIWTSSLGSPLHDVGYCIRETSDGYFVVCGTWADPTYNEINDFAGDVFVALLNPYGDTVWTWKYLGGNNILHGGANYILEDDDGNFVLTGGMRHAGYNKKHAFLLKLRRSDQSVLWEQIFPPEDYVSYTTCVIKTPDNDGFILSGLVYPPNHNGCDVYIVKTDSVGDTIWTNMTGEWGDYEARHMDLTFDGGIIITGNTGFDTTTRIAYIMKIDSMGNYEWHKHFPSGYPNVPTSCFGIKQTTDSGFLLTGYHPNIHTNSQDLSLIKTDQAGDTIWRRLFGNKIGSQYYDKGYALALLSDGYAIVGFTNEGNGGKDMYFVRTNENGIITSTQDSPFQNFINISSQIILYPNPSNDYINIAASNEGKLELINIKGETLYKKDFSGPQRIDISLYSKGLYFMKISRENTVEVMKFIIN